ncbi:MAG: pilus assembly PilX N-terminal domain-containing protein [Nitrospirae bacterium]|nr:pilus assembly PilX N-terminal domain-containing protein [Nitrospirota bacterium]
MKHTERIRYYYRNESGIALAVALLFTLIGLAIVMAVIYLVIQETRMSGFHKTYHTSLEASHGAVDIFTKEIISKTMITGATLSGLGTYGDRLQAHATDACFSDKISKKTTDWAAGCSSSIDAKTSPDITLTLRGIPPQADFNVFTKIVDTNTGNSSKSGVELVGLGVAESNSSIITPMHIPYILRIEAQGERVNNPDERTNISVLYAY